MVADSEQLRWYSSENTISSAYTKSRNIYICFKTFKVIRSKSNIVTLNLSALTAACYRLVTSVFGSS